MLIRAHYKFSFVGKVDVVDGDEHGAKVALADLEKAILDEFGNWPVTELNRVEVSATLDGHATL